MTSDLHSTPTNPAASTAPPTCSATSSTSTGPHDLWLLLIAGLSLAVLVGTGVAWAIITTLEVIR